MSKAEYQELVEFLGMKFEGLEERLTRVEIQGEETRHQLQIVAEGLTGLRSEVEVGFSWTRSEFGAVRSEMAEGFQAVRSEMADGFKAVRFEMADGFRGQGRTLQELDGRVTRMESLQA